MYRVGGRIRSYYDSRDGNLEAMVDQSHDRGVRCGALVFTSVSGLLARVIPRVSVPSGGL